MESDHEQTGRDGRPRSKYTRAWITSRPYHSTIRAHAVFSTCGSTDQGVRERRCPVQSLPLWRWRPQSIDGSDGSGTFDVVLDEEVVLLGARSLPDHTHLLPRRQGQANSLKAAQTVAARQLQERDRRTLAINDVFLWANNAISKAFYQTKHRSSRWTNDARDPREMLLGGQVRVLPQPKHPNSAFTSVARETRAPVSTAGWARIVAFQTRIHCTAPTSMPWSSAWKS